MKSPIIYVDVDDTFVRSFGTKRIPMPATIRQIRVLYEQGATLYCWSSGVPLRASFNLLLGVRRYIVGVRAAEITLNPALANLASKIVLWRFCPNRKFLLTIRTSATGVI